jgi:uncharacterized membrane protein YqjE
MTLKTEKEIRLVGQTAVATALYLSGFPIMAALLVLLILPWQPIYRVAAHLGGVVLDMKAKRTVKRAMRRLNEAPMEVA